MKLKATNFRRGVTLIEVLVIVVIVTILVVILLPTGIGVTKEQVTRTQCSSNLKQVGIAFQTWALDNSNKFPMQISMTNRGTMEFAQRGIVFINFLVLSNELTTPKLLICPTDKEKSPTASFVSSFNNQNVSYFVDIDASQEMFSGFLSGDRNITNGFPARQGMMELTTNQPASWTEQLHRGRGNVLLADGSVQRFSSASLRLTLLHTMGLTTNRLAIP